MPAAQKIKVTHLEDRECICEYTSRLFSPITLDDECYFVAENGDVLKRNEGGDVVVVFTILGQPSSLCYREEEGCFLVADFAHQSIFSREENSTDSIHNLICEYNDRAFLGPNCVRVGPNSKSMYFTDSGPFLETSIENRAGSFFVYRFESKKLRCLAERSLAFPSGFEIDEHQKVAFLCETGQNRILKFLLDESSAGNYTVFHQFSGRFGPTAIFSYEGDHYVSLFQFQALSQLGMIAVLNSQGELTSKFTVPTGPQITGICFHQDSNLSYEDVLFITEGKRIHKVSLQKGSSQSKLSESIVIAK